MKKILTLILCCFMVLAVMTACAEEKHEHTFDTQLEYDSEYHWYPATCEHTDVVKDKEAHIDENNDGLCDVCACETGHEHTFESAWTHDANKHWHKATCGHNNKKDEGTHEDKNNDGVCDVCSYDYGHTHTYAEAWTATEGGHWHAPTCGHATPGKDLTAHADTDNDGACDACGFDDGHKHSYAETWSTDANDHWKEVTCGHNVPAAERDKHADADGDGKCDVCGSEQTHFHSFDTSTWLSDATGHWYAASCEHTEQRKNEGAHVGFEDDGVCDTCGYSVYQMYDVVINGLPGYVQLTDEQGNALTAPFRVKEGTKLSFKLVVPTYAKLESISGVTLGEPVKDGDNNVYTISLTVSGNTELKAVVNKLKASEVIVQKGEGTITTEGYHAGISEIKFNAPAAGKYAIYSLSDGLVQFCEIGVYKYGQYCVFEVPEAGEFSVEARCYGNGLGTNEIPFTYHIIKLDDKLTLPYLEGSGYVLPTMVPVEVWVTLPKAGLYQITSSYANLAINDDVSKPYFVNAPTDNYEMKLILQHQINQYPVQVTEFNLDWKIELVAAETEFVLGENKITVPINRKLGFTFTAAEAGDYKLTTGNEYVRFNTINALGTGFMPEGTTFEVKLAAGETVTLYLDINTYAMPDDMELVDIADVITITKEGGDGAENDSFTLDATAGETLVEMVPGKEYFVMLTGSAYAGFDGTDYILNWTDKNITVVYNDQVFTSSPASIEDYNVRNNLTIVYNGSEKKQIAFTLIDNYQNPDAPEVNMIVGNNKIDVTVIDGFCEGTKVNFTAPNKGNFTLAAASGEKNAEVWLITGKDNFGDDIMEVVELPYKFSANKGQKISFLVVTTKLSESKDTIDLVLSQEEHKHTFSEAWSFDENGHYHAATCEHTSEKSGYADHKYDAKGVCTVCKYEHKHTYEEKWTSDDNNHWHADSCGHGAVSGKAAHDYDAKGICKTCGFEHKHSYADVWSSDDSNHWKEVTCGHNVDAAQMGAHADANKDGKCDTCEKAVAHYHSFDTSKWVTDATHHWYAATCGHDAKDALGAHDYDSNFVCKVCKYKHEHSYDAKGVCSVCGIEHAHTYEEAWTDDGTNHYHKVTCGHDVPNKNIGAHEYDSKGICGVCKLEHQHTYEEAWTDDGTNHYHKVTCGHEDVPLGSLGAHEYDSKGICKVCKLEHAHTYEDIFVKLDKDYHIKKPTCCKDAAPLKEAHEDLTNDGICEGCGWDYDHTHTYGDFVGEMDGHWKEPTCGHNVGIIESGEHVDANLDGICDTCKYKVGLNDPILNMLNGEFSASFMEMELYKFTFKPAAEKAPNGTVIVVDSYSGQYGGTYTYVYDPTTIKTTGLKLTDKNGKAFTGFAIKANDAGELVLCSAELPVSEIVMDQLSAPVEMEQLQTFSFTLTVTGEYNSPEHTISFKAPYTGTFLLKAAPGVRGVHGWGRVGEMIGLPYEFSLKKGETFTMSISSSSTQAGEINVKLLLLGAEGEYVPAYNQMILGENSVKVTHQTEAGNWVYFKAEEKGTYKITVIDEFGCIVAYVREGGSAYVLGDDGYSYTTHEMQAGEYFDFRLCYWTREDNTDGEYKPEYTRPTFGTMSRPYTVTINIEKIG